MWLGGLLSFGLLVVWLASGYWVFYLTNCRYFEIEVSLGIIGIDVDSLGFKQGAPSDYIYFVLADGSFYLDWWRWTLRPYGVGVYSEFPVWVLFLATFVPTVFLYRSRRHSRRVGCCAQCGYDLTGNVSGRCPECGQPMNDAGGGVADSGVRRRRFSRSSDDIDG